MKQFIALFLLLSLQLCAIGCQKKGKLEETPTSTEESLQITVSPTTSSTSETSIATTTYPVEYEDCYLQQYFDSIKDFELYLKTGSKNPDDYSTKPHPGFKYLPHTEAFDGYFSIFSILDVNLDSFEETYASFRYTNKGTVDRYGFTLDYIEIDIIKTDADTITDYMRQNYHTSESEYFLYALYHSDNKSFYGSDYFENRDSVFYKVENDVLRTGIYFLCGEYAVEIKISPTYYYTMHTAVRKFNTLEKSAPFAKLFSENDSVFNFYIRYIQNNWDEHTL